MIAELPPRAKVIELDISLDSYQRFMQCIMALAHKRTSCTVCFANVHMAIEVKQDQQIARAVNGADYVLPDGMPLVWGLRSLYGLKQQRTTGMDMLPDLIRKAEEQNVPVFFYGSTPEVLKRVEENCAIHYPGLTIAGAISPPFRPLSAAEEAHTIDTINRSGAGLVFVALGCPKQELWMNRMRGQISAVMLGIGGALPVLAGEVNRAPEWMQNAGMEWLFRLIQEPKRLFKRYAVTNTLYVWYLTQQIIRKNLHR